MSSGDRRCSPPSQKGFSELSSRSVVSLTEFDFAENQVICHQGGYRDRWCLFEDHCKSAIIRTPGLGLSWSYIHYLILDNSKQFESI